MNISAVRVLSLSDIITLGGPCTQNIAANNLFAVSCAVSVPLDAISNSGFCNRRGSLNSRTGVT